jgi:two-component system NtrC family sensor kinase
VTLAHRAKAALDLLSGGERYDLVFSDILMPGGMDGVRFAEELHRRFPKVAVLLATGYSEAMPAALAKGLPVITKPYDGHALCERVGELLRGGRER